MKLAFGVDTLSYHCRLEAGEVSHQQICREVRDLGFTFLQLNAYHLRAMSPGDVASIHKEANSLDLDLTLSGDVIGRAMNGDTVESGVQRVGWVELAQAIGSPYVRVSSGFYRNELLQRPGAILAEHDYVIRVLSAAAEQAPPDCTVLLENHSDFTPDEYVEIVEQVGAGKMESSLTSSTRCRCSSIRSRWFAAWSPGPGPATSRITAWCRSTWTTASTAVASRCSSATRAKASRTFAPWSGRSSTPGAMTPSTACPSRVSTAGPVTTTRPAVCAKRWPASALSWRTTPPGQPGPAAPIRGPDVTRVPYLEEHDLAEQDRELLARPINLFRALANNPGALRQWASFGDWVRWHGSIDPRRRELAIIQVGLSARSPYEVTHHVEISRGFGVTEADLDDLARLADGQQGRQLSAVNLAVVNAARELSVRGSLAAATWTALVDGVGQPDAVEFVVVMGFYTMVTQVLSALEIDVEPDYEQHLVYFNRAARR